MKSICSLLLIYSLAFSIPSVDLDHGPLQISENHRYLVHKDGTPFFWLGDTAWELFHRTSRQEAELYLTNRAAKGFTVIQAVVLAELDGLNTPNVYGDRPLHDNDPARLNEAYFEHVDFIVNKAQELGMFIGMLPTWGDKFNKQWGVGPEIFTSENAHTFGKFLGDRYKDAPIIWILGGDRNPVDDQDMAIIQAMAKGLHKGDNGRHLKTYHPQGNNTSSTWFHEKDWLDFNMFQSGHDMLNKPNYQMLIHDYDLQPAKPVLDGEPCYEDHPINWNTANGWFDDFDSRRAGYWSMLAGAMGHTYGNHNIWQMWLPERNAISWARTPWIQAIDHPGAFQAGVMRRIFESFPWQTLVPDQGLIQSAPNSTGKDTRSASFSNGNGVIVYTPYGSTFILDQKKLSAKKWAAKWVHAASGHEISIGNIQITNNKSFDPPADEKRGNDWLLILQSVE